MFAIQARDIEFKYAGASVSVLKGLTLDMPMGTVLCLMGVNGCGKSTFLDCVLGNNVSNKGDLRVMGKTVAALKPAQLARLVAYVPQEHHHTFPYSVWHVVQMGRTVYQTGLGTGDPESNERVKQALKICGIEHLAQRSYTSLSGGEMQMTMLARALVQDAPLIVLDEPTVHLDFRNELLFLETLKSLLETRSLSVLMATHNPNQAFHLVHAGLDVQIALMANGRVHCVDTPHNALTPQTLRAVFGIEALLLEQDYCFTSAQGKAHGKVTQIANIALARGDVHEA